MASTATPSGAEPTGTLSASGSFTGKVRHYPIASAYGTQISYGDFVKCVNDGTVDRAAVPNTNQKTFSQYWPAGTVASDAVAYVCDDPHLVFKMQADGTMAATTLFNNAAVIDTAGGTLGRSKSAIDASSAATTNTLPIRIVELIDNPEGNDFRDVLCTYLPGSHALLVTTGV
jgi:hypothetical protein